MVRTQVQLREEQYRRIRQIAHENQLSIAEVVRRLLDTGMQGDTLQPPHNAAAELLKVAGIGASGLPDLGKKHDEYLAEDLDG